MPHVTVPRRQTHRQQNTLGTKEKADTTLRDKVGSKWRHQIQQTDVRHKRHGSMINPKDTETGQYNTSNTKTTHATDTGTQQAQGHKRQAQQIRQTVRLGR